MLSLAFALPHGTPQLVLIGLGMLMAAGTTGPAGAMVANLTHSVHGTAFATLTLANNLLGLAAGPFITGVLADPSACDGVPTSATGQPLAAAVFFFAKCHYLGDIQQVGWQCGQAAPAREALA